jgi:hypothetical protein
MTGITTVAGIIAAITVSARGAAKRTSRRSDTGAGHSSGTPST